MNANGRRCREFKNGFAKFAKICGKSYAGGRPIFHAKTSLSVAAAIAAERAKAAKLAKIKR